jgi:hypothetical protein
MNLEIKCFGTESRIGLNWAKIKALMMFFDAHFVNSKNIIYSYLHAIYR